MLELDQPIASQAGVPIGADRNPIPDPKTQVGSKTCASQERGAASLLINNLPVCPDAQAAIGLYEEQLVRREPEYHRLCGPVIRLEFLSRWDAAGRPESSLQTCSRFVESCNAVRSGASRVMCLAIHALQWRLSTEPAITAEPELIKRRRRERRRRRSHS